MAEKCPNCEFTVELAPRERRSLTKEIERLTAANASLGKQLEDVESWLNSETAKRLTLTAEVRVLRKILSDSCGCTDGWDCPICQQIKCAPDGMLEDFFTEEQNND